jgi:hypothetical protein
MRATLFSGLEYLGCDAEKCEHNLRIFRRTHHGAQVKQHAAFFHARNNRRIIAPEPRGQFVGA